MTPYSTDAEDTEELFDLLIDKDSEIETLHDEMHELLSRWLFAERHELKIADMTWLEKHHIKVQDMPDGEWGLWCRGRCLQRADTVRKAIDILKAFRDGQ